MHDGDSVFVVNHHTYDLPTPIQIVDYFHGVHPPGYVIAQMSHGETNVYAFDMLHTGGCFAKAVRYIQRLFRAKRIYKSLSARQLLPWHISRYPVITYGIAMYLPR